MQDGNEAVLRARFEDAKFFYQGDVERTLKEVRPKLAGTTFQKDLGSLLDKSDRIESIIAPLAAVTGLEEAAATATAAAHICRADLATSMDKTLLWLLRYSNQCCLETQVMSCQSVLLEFWSLLLIN